MRRHHSPFSVLLLAFALAVWPQATDAITLAQGGFTSSALSEFPGDDARGVQRDDAGTLYVALANAGIVTIAEDGSQIPWSSIAPYHFALAPGGGGYAVDPETGKDILRLGAGGSFTTLVPGDSIAWVSLAVGPDASLWAIGQTIGGGNRIYAIDIVTGVRTTVIEGVSSPEASTIYRTLAFGNDAKLHVFADVYGPGVAFKLFRIEGAQAIEEATLPRFAIALSPGRGSSFYFLTAHDYGSGYPVGEVWSVDAFSGASSLFASCSPDQAFWGVAYSPGAGKLFIGEHAKRNVLPDDTLWRISGDELPVRTRSWGAVKTPQR